LIARHRRAAAIARGGVARAVFAWALATAAQATGAAELASPIGAGDQPAAPWRVVGLPGQKKPLTRFTVVEQQGQRVLRVEAERAYGNLVHALPGAHAGTLSWRWRVDQPPVGADLRRKSGDDAALKVCALFDMPLADVPFVERQLLRLVSSRAGESLPTATLCYVWDNALPRGSVLHNAFTQRLRFVVLHGTPGQWSDERHDLAADFRRAFGDEAERTPPLTAIAIGADSDNTASHSIGYVDRLRLTTTP
jgi:Protein of unknown function (DUF3047)